MLKYSFPRRKHVVKTNGLSASMIKRKSRYYVYHNIFGYHKILKDLLTINRTLGDDSDFIALKYAL